VQQTMNVDSLHLSGRIVHGNWYCGDHCIRIAAGYSNPGKIQSSTSGEDMMGALHLHTPACDIFEEPRHRSYALEQFGRHLASALLYFQLLYQSYRTLDCTKSTRSLTIQSTRAWHRQCCTCSIQPWRLEQRLQTAGAELQLDM
jgi:hypothetical protein